MRVAIYGAGALGTILGAYLEKAGQPVDLFNHNAEHIKALRKHGVVISGTVDETLPVTAYTDDAMTGVYDLIMLMTRQLNNQTDVPTLLPHLAPDGVLCTVQNGLPEPSLSEMAGADRVMGCIVTWGATLLGPGQVRMTSTPEAMMMSLGMVGALNPQKLAAVREVLGKACTVTVDENFIGARWSKLLINAAFSGTSTVFGVTFGEIADNRKTRRVAQRVIKEAIDIAKAADIRIEPVQGHDIAKLFDYNNPIKRMLSFALIPATINKHRSILAGLLQDLARGRRTEIDCLNGLVAEWGARYGIATPVNATITRLVHEMERGERKPGLDNIADFAQFL